MSRMNKDYKTLWDEKFGFIDEDNFTQRMKEQEMYNATPGAIVEGVGKDAPTIMNGFGGKQSLNLYAPHLLDPDFLDAMGDEEGVLHHIANYMRTESPVHLFLAIEDAYPTDSTPHIAKVADRLLTISKVLKEGADKYEANNWRLIPSEAHLSHALTHYLAFLAGDTQDDHLAHFLCRLMMVYATPKTEGFSYTEYIPRNNS